MTWLQYFDKWVTVSVLTIAIGCVLFLYGCGNG